VTLRPPGNPGTCALAALALSVLACSQARAPTAAEPTPGLVFPAKFAEGEEQDAGAAPLEPALTEPAKRSTSPPDPEPLRQAEQYEYTFAYDSGATRVLSVRPVKFRQPVVTARKMGRFAVELWIGGELVDRVRFDFPLLAAEEPPQKKKKLNAPPSLAGGVLKATVLVPAASRARRAVLVDRATDRETELDWPPNLGDPARDAGAPSDAGARDAGAPSDAGGAITW
jgi:hypothetical protein